MLLWVHGASTVLSRTRPTFRTTTLGKRRTMQQVLLDQGAEMFALGGSPLEYLGILVISVLLSVTSLAALVRLRGQSPALLASCARDFLIGCGLALTVLGLGVALFFIGRAFWKAALYVD